MTVKLLTEHHLELLSLKVGCTGSSDFTLVKMPHCWKSHVTAGNHMSRLISHQLYDCVVVATCIVIDSKIISHIDHVDQH